ncbi:MAG: aspartate carbamoyltransferase catalytic subunit [Alphaproteobacteria bacterium]|jgi:aspartate carbamoyltransferase catalytic subunit
MSLIEKFLYPPNYQFNKPHLTQIKNLSEFDVAAILDHAAVIANMTMQEKQNFKPLLGKTQINLFFENSTRTLASFELAGKRIGADVLNMATNTSSIKKGETLIDTAVTLNAMNPDVLIVRHNQSGAADLLAQKVNCAVLNAGDGTHEHPTQALLDAFTIRQHFGTLHHIKLAICGDILHSRVARSNIILMNLMGAEVRLIAPKTLLPADIEKFGCKVYTDLHEGIKDVDVIMCLRLQQERMKGGFLPSLKEYYHYYGINHEILKYAKPHTMVMHPGPANRGVEISSELIDDPAKSLVRKQVENGVFVRQAVLDLITRNRQKVSDL